MKPNTKANDVQIGGGHYKTGGEEHWDRVRRLGLDYFQACITKYVERCWKKNGVEDLKKARHFLDKYIELNEGDVPPILPVENTPAQFLKLREGVFRCGACGSSFSVAPGEDPYLVHGDCAGRGYIAQD